MLSLDPFQRSGRSQRAVGLAIASLAAGTLALAPTRAAAQQTPTRGLGIIRDAETEQLLREYAAPIFKAAGVPAAATQIILVNDRTFNAFVANGQKIFINVGALMDAETPNEVIGVIAHETGHIAGGHLARLGSRSRTRRSCPSSACWPAPERWSARPSSGGPGRRHRARRHGRADRRPGDDPAQPFVVPALGGAGGRFRRRCATSRPRASPPRGCSTPLRASPIRAFSGPARSIPT